MVAVLLAALPAACRTPSPTGGLDVRVVGLPAGLDAHITAIGPDGTADVLTSSTILTDVAVGRYAFVITDVCASDDEPCLETDLFRAARPTFEVDLPAGAVVTVEVRYGCALLVPPDPALGGALLDAVRQQLGDPNAILSCANVGALTSFSPGPLGIVDLRGLENALALTSLFLGRNPGVDDLSPIAGLTTLTSLTVGNSDVHASEAALEDLSPVAGLVNLETLFVGHARATTLPDLSALTALRALRVIHVDLSDLGPLAAVPQLTELDLGYCVGSRPASSSLEDITPLSGLTALTRLDLGCHAIRDVSPLAGMHALRFLDLNHNDIADLGPLDGLVALEALAIDQNGLLRDLSPVARWPQLRSLTASETLVDDLRLIYLQVGRYGTLESVELESACKYANRVPNEGYASAIVGAGVALRTSSVGRACGYGLHPPPAMATFEVDAEGWTTAGDAVNLHRVEGGGPSGGPYLEADDDQAGVAWYWQAGPVFLGDAGAYQGGDLTFTLKQSAIDAQSGPADDVLLEGAGRTLAFRHDVPIGTDWTEVTVTLVASAGWQAETGPATDADLAEVLGNVTRLRIRGEYRFGPDTGGLGRVRMEPEPID